jgi:hypothetical protein
MVEQECMRRLALSILSEVFLQPVDLVVLARGSGSATQGCYFLGARSQKVVIVSSDFVAGVSVTTDWKESSCDFSVVYLCPEFREP